MIRQRIREKLKQISTDFRKILVDINYLVADIIELVADIASIKIIDKIENYKVWFQVKVGVFYDARRRRD